MRLSSLRMAFWRHRPQNRLVLRLVSMRHATFVALLATVLGEAACVRVQAYERAQLAHPTMTTSDLARPAEEHVRAVQEGAVGGGFSAGGGCGCN